MTETAIAVQLHDFACPVCGRIRPLTGRAATNLLAGRSSGECRSGEGCQARIDEPERYRRFWLQHAGVTERAIRAAGGAQAWVAANEFPEALRALADVLPREAAAWERPRRGDQRQTRLAA